MVEPLTASANGSVRVFRNVYKSLGFQKGYNFVLWFIFAGALFGFVLARAEYLNIPGVFCGSNLSMNHAAPGECYYYDNFNQYKIGIRLHLYTIIPAGFLVPLQFTPIIRYKFRLFHRINGYLLILLGVLANVGALMIARPAFGGSLATQSWVGFTVILTTIGLGLALYNIKRLQIDQHRAWMLRTWFYFANIITLRLIDFCAAMIISKIGGYYFVQPCAKLGEIFDNNKGLTTFYPVCTDPNAQAIVTANFFGNPAELTTALNTCFGFAGWMALALHAIGVEIYLHLTPRESARLRNVSYQRQLEAGMKNPGNAGLTVQRIGDADEFVFDAAPKSRRVGSDTVTLLAPDVNTASATAGRNQKLKSDETVLVAVDAGGGKK